MALGNTLAHDNGALEQSPARSEAEYRLHHSVPSQSEPLTQKSSLLNPRAHEIGIVPWNLWEALQPGLAWPDSLQLRDHRRVYPHSAEPFCQLISYPACPTTAVVATIAATVRSDRNEWSGV